MQLKYLILLVCVFGLVVSVVSYGAKSPKTDERIFKVAEHSYAHGCLVSAMRNCPKLRFVILVGKCYDDNTERCQEDGKKFAEWLRGQK